ncbi:Telomere repeat-binding factor 5 [Sesamum angolense]|uniref:Telomere repeat-binding factor 5 n=1 Tax=Sesamum angolense TaxID=2727404 RepID=A0AAE1WNP1_9LAMI|nr:Telomere repeat-binding factor 5 [Sesamum angolense]
MLIACGLVVNRYNAMIYEALSTLKEPNGSDSGAIANFIESQLFLDHTFLQKSFDLFTVSDNMSKLYQRHEVPQNFKRVLSSRLRRLVLQENSKSSLFVHLLRVAQNCYKIKRDAVLDTKTPAAIQKDQRPRPVPSIGYLGDTVEEAAISAAYKIAEAENKSFVAAESVKEAERVSTMAEDMESLLQFAVECFDQSARGEILLMA